MAKNLDDRFPKHLPNATSTSDGLMSGLDKARLDSIFEDGYLSPATHFKDGLMVKEDKKKLDGIEENANNYVHPDTPEIRHVTDAEKEKWNSGARYTNTNPMPIEVGGLKQGTTFNDKSVAEMFDMLLYPYVAPTITGISINPNQRYHEVGTTFTLTQANFSFILKSGKLNELILKYNSNILKEIHGTVENTQNIPLNVSINEPGTLIVTVKDTKDKINTFQLIAYIFISPIYSGVLNADDVIDENLIKSKTKRINPKGNNKIPYTTNNQKIMYAYPKSYGKLSTIIDRNGFNIIGTFKITEVNIVGLDGKTVPYYVYNNDLCTVSNYNITFNF